MIRRRPSLDAPPRRPFPGPRRQRGVALIIALILVALATILATKLSYDGWLERRRTIGIIATEQAYLFGTGAEALAADALNAIGQTGTTSGSTAPTVPGQSPQQVNLTQPWAQPTQPLPISSPENPEGEPIGVLQAAIQDMQGRFNLNNLAHMTQVNGQLVEDPVPLEQFQRLLVLVGLEPKWAGIARDWIDPDDQAGQPDGAEDNVYTMQNPPYRTGNWPMMSPAELMNLPGFGADRYRKIAPYVTALPSAMVPINVCTAPAAVIESLADSLSGEYSDEVLANGRKSGCFPDPNTLTAIIGQKNGIQIAKFGDTSQYFRLTTRVTLGTTQFTLYSLLYRGQGGKVTPLLRSFGTL
jgi:general secretion pathway protein K